MKNYVLYNPLAGNGRGEKSINSVEIEKGEAVFLDVTDITDFESFFSGLDREDRIILCGGDGTLNHFLNAVKNIDIQNEIFYLGAGSGNDFLNDLNIKPTNTPLKINDYITNLPYINTGDKSYCFINGIGCGIDGYCCKEVNRRRRAGKKASYTLIALKGLLFAFKPLTANVTVDGKEYNYERVWMVPVMLGRFFGGGMMIAPTQDRANEDGTVSVIVAHNLSKIKIALLFLSVFKGKHLKYKKYVAFHTGHNIHVKFNKPAPLQVDGETISDISEYTVTANKNLITK